MVHPLEFCFQKKATISQLINKTIKRRTQIWRYKLLASVLLNYMFKSTHHQKEANDLTFQGLPNLITATATINITIIQSNT